MTTATLSIDPLFEPLTLGSVTLPNRIVMAPMTREFCPGGAPGADVAEYYAKRARGGVGLIITEGVGVDHPAAVDKVAIPVLHGEAALAGWRGVVDAVHAEGGLIIPQLWHQGIVRDRDLSTRPDLVGVRPSGVWGPEGGTVSIEPDFIEKLRPTTSPATEEEIQDVIDAFARSAAAAIDVGFDGVAIHGAHGYLIDAFLWGETNQRTDAWGGDRVLRTRFAAEVVKAIRGAVPAKTPVIFRFSQFKLQDYRAEIAHTPAELEEVLGPIAEAGVDVFDASQRYFNLPVFEGSDLNLAGWARKVTGLPSMTVGGVGLNKGFGASTVKRTDSDAVNNLDLLMSRFNREEFDLVGVGRSLLNDATWVRKARAGEPFDVFDTENLRRLN